MRMKSPFSIGMSGRLLFGFSAYCCLGLFLSFACARVGVCLSRSSIEEEVETETGIPRSRRGSCGVYAFASLLSGGNSEIFCFFINC